MSDQDAQPRTPVTSPALVASLVLKTTGGKHFSTSVQIDQSAPTGTYYVHLAQGSATVPADGAYVAPVGFLHSPVEVIHATGTPDYVNISDEPAGRFFATGLCVVLSTTQYTKTIAGAYMAVDSGVL